LSGPRSIDVRMLGADSHALPNGPTASRALRSVPRVESGVIDLRRLNGRWLLLGAPILWALSAVVVVAAVRGDVDGGLVARVVVGVLGGFFGLLAIVVSLALFDLRRPRRLLIDHEGIRLDTGRRTPEFRLAWTEIGAVSLRLSDNAGASTPGSTTAGSIYRRRRRRSLRRSSSTRPIRRPCAGIPSCAGHGGWVASDAGCS
jgi:hypothetical protein